MSAAQSIAGALAASLTALAATAHAAWVVEPSVELRSAYDDNVRLEVPKESCGHQRSDGSSGHSLGDGAIGIGCHHRRRLPAVRGLFRSRESGQPGQRIRQDHGPTPRRTFRAWGSPPTFAATTCSGARRRSCSRGTSHRPPVTRWTRPRSTCRGDRSAAGDADTDQRGALLRVAAQSAYVRQDHLRVRFIVVRRESGSGGRTSATPRATAPPSTSAVASPKWTRRTWRSRRPGSTPIPASAEAVRSQPGVEPQLFRTGEREPRAWARER